MLKKQKKIEKQRKEKVKIINKISLLIENKRL